MTDSPEKGIVYQLSNIGIDCGDTLLVYTGELYINLLFIKDILSR